ncbi:unnamed protein product, partial [Mesorhabditis spiculigera]
MCPDGGMPYDYEECDPTARSQCPEGFTCRGGTLRGSSDAIVYVCCSTINMSIGDWFTDLDLAPSHIPYIPLVKLSSVYIADALTNASSPPIHVGDEVIALSYPSYVTASLSAVTFPVPPVGGGFLHILTIIDADAYPYALMLTANLLTPSSVNCLVGSQSPDFYFFISNGTVPEALSYRHQYSILVFSTPTRLQASGLSQTNTLTQSSNSLMDGCNDISCFFTKSTIGTQLGSPLAGSLFYHNMKTFYFMVLTLFQSASTFSFGSLFGGLGTTQAVGVRGILMCEGKPAANVKVKLWDSDRGIDLDDLMDSGVSDSRGHFELRGYTSEISTIDPQVDIYHDCNDGKKPCQRKVVLDIPDTAISEGKIPKTIFNMGTLELSGQMGEETRSCLNRM